MRPVVNSVPATAAEPQARPVVNSVPATAAEPQARPVVNPVPATAAEPLESWVVCRAWRYWWKAPNHKPLILTTELDPLIIKANSACQSINVNADVKLAMVLATFINSEREFIGYESLSRMTIEHMSSGKVLVIDERVSDVEDYEMAVELYKKYGFPFIIIPSEYVPLKLTHPEEYSFFKCRSQNKDWDWYRWIKTMQEIGLVNRKDGTN